MADKRKDKNAALEAQVHQSLTDMGWAAPESESDVRRAEAELSDSPATLPPALTDPASIFDTEAARGFAVSETIKFSPSAGVSQNLARAAREGGQISPEIEERMRRDRKAAEDACEEDQDGQDIG